MSLMIGLHIAHALTTNEELTKRIGNRVFPILYPIKSQPQYPYIVYASNGVEPEATKECNADQDEGTAEITICAKTYKELVEVANLARYALNHPDNVEYEDFNVDDWDISSGNEDYDLGADCFFVTLNYQFVTTAYYEE